MSRDGDSGSMASRRRVWYYEHQRYLREESTQERTESLSHRPDFKGNTEGIRNAWNGEVD